MRYLFICLAGFSSLCYTNIAKAYSCPATSSFSITLPDITIDNSWNIGDKIGSPVSGAYNYAYICNGITSEAYAQITGFKAVGEYAMSSSDGVRIYKTNIAGLGYAVGGLNGNCQVEGWVSTGANILGDVNSTNLCSKKDNAVAARPAIQLYKIDQKIGSGTVSTKQVGTVAMAVNGSLFPASQSKITMNSFQVISPGCTVNTPTISVDMGTVVKNQFNGAGTFVNDVKNFNILLNCPANTSVSMRIDGNIYSAEKGLLLISTGTGQAAGVAIQLLYNGAPFTLGSPMSVGTSVAEGTFTIPLQARYYQYASTVRAGAADSSATFTLTYQ